MWILLPWVVTAINVIEMSAASMQRIARHVMRWLNLWDISVMRAGFVGWFGHCGAGKLRLGSALTGRVCGEGGRGGWRAMGDSWTTRLFLAGVLSV